MSNTADQLLIFLDVLRALALFSLKAYFKACIVVNIHYRDVPPTITSRPA